MSKHLLLPHTPKRRGQSRWEQRFEAFLDRPRTQRVLKHPLTARTLDGPLTMPVLYGGGIIALGLTVAAIITSIPWGQM